MAAFFEANFRWLHGYTTMLVRDDHELAADLAQETLEAALREWEALRQYSAERQRAWLRGRLAVRPADRRGANPDQDLPATGDRPHAVGFLEREPDALGVTHAVCQYLTDTLGRRGPPWLDAAARAQSDDEQHNEHAHRRGERADLFPVVPTAVAAPQQRTIITLIAAGNAADLFPLITTAASAAAALNGAASTRRLRGHFWPVPGGHRHRRAHHRASQTGRKLTQATRSIHGERQSPESVRVSRPSAGPARAQPGGHGRGRDSARPTPTWPATWPPPPPAAPAPPGA